MRRRNGGCICIVNAEHSRHSCVVLLWLWILQARTMTTLVDAEQLIALVFFLFCITRRDGTPTIWQCMRPAFGRIQCTQFIRCMFVHICAAAHKEHNVVSRRAIFVWSSDYVCVCVCMCFLFIIIYHSIPLRLIARPTHSPGQAFYSVQFNINNNNNKSKCMCTHKTINKIQVHFCFSFIFGSFVTWNNQDNDQHKNYYCEQKTRQKLGESGDFEYKSLCKYQ